MKEPCPQRDALRWRLARNPIPIVLRETGRSGAFLEMLTFRVHQSRWGGAAQALTMGRHGPHASASHAPHAPGMRRRIILCLHMPFTIVPADEHRQATAMDVSSLGQPCCVKCRGGAGSCAPSPRTRHGGGRKEPQLDARLRSAGRARACEPPATPISAARAVLAGPLPSPRVGLRARLLRRYAVVHRGVPSKPARHTCRPPRALPRASAGAQQARVSVRPRARARVRGRVSKRAAARPPPRLPCSARPRTRGVTAFRRSAQRRTAHTWRAADGSRVLREADGHSKAAPQAAGGAREQRSRRQPSAARRTRRGSSFRPASHVLCPLARLVDLMLNSGS